MKGIPGSEGFYFCILQDEYVEWTNFRIGIVALNYVYIIYTNFLLFKIIHNIYYMPSNFLQFF